MSEKRFNIAYGGNVITDEDGRDLDLTVKWCVEELVGLLNKLAEENEQLRFALRTEQALARVEKDNRPFLSKEEFLKELENE